MGEKRRAYRTLWGYLSEKGHLEDIGVVGKIILKWMYKKWNEEVGTRLFWLGKGTGIGLL